jgi:hypothetical protein
MKNHLGKLPPYVVLVIAVVLVEMVWFSLAQFSLAIYVKNGSPMFGHVSKCLATGWSLTHEPAINLSHRLFGQRPDYDPDATLDWRYGVTFIFAILYATFITSVVYSLVRILLSLRKSAEGPR